MDEKLLIFNNLIKEKKEKYPNIAHIWKNYIKIKKTQIEKILDKGIEMFTNIEQLKTEDMDMETIILLYILHVPINDNN